MNKKELNEELKRMRQAGLNPLKCDTAVPLVDVPVLAGYPAEAGDSSDGEHVLLPRKLVGRHPVFLIDAEGLSMKDAGIMSGDRLEVQMGTEVADGDIVVAEVDGSYTVKTLFTDEDGTMWLVPQNSEYDAIALTGSLWRIIGKVIGLRKSMQRTPYSDCAKAVMRMRRQSGEHAPAPSAQTPQTEQPKNLVFKAFSNRRPIDFATIRSVVERVIVMQMRHCYEWYAVYRVTMDLKMLDELKLTKFAQQMQAWFPDTPLRCTADALGDYAVGHTGKAFKLWNSEQYRQERRKRQTVTAFNILYHRCEELRAALFPLPTLELGLPM